MRKKTTKKKGPKPQQRPLLKKLTGLHSEDIDLNKINKKEKMQRVVAQMTLNDMKKQEFAKNYVDAGGINMCNIVRTTFPDIELKSKRNGDWVDAGNFLISDPDVQKYVSEMMLKIREGHCRTKNDILSDIFEIKSLAMSKGKYKEALDALKLESRILGYGETRVDVNVTHESSTLAKVLLKMEHEEKKQLMAKKQIENKNVIEAEVIND